MVDIMIFLIVFLIVFVISIVGVIFAVLRNNNRSSFLCEDVDGAVRGQFALFETSNDLDNMKKCLNKNIGKF